ncbi:MAG: hypothetical protein Q8Q08_12980 [Candidatus Omnitrophota bacterium]|nr:hypothetical protein [Candidatus Omnitrophota bacterium]
MSIFEDKTPEQLDALAEDLIFMQREFGKLGFFAYPAFGTLLGIVRGGDFIKGDTDIDIAWHSPATTRAGVGRETLINFHAARRRKILAFVHNYAGTMKVERRSGEQVTYGDWEIPKRETHSEFRSKEMKWGSYLIK